MIEAISIHRFLLKINASGADIPSSDTSRGVHMGHADVKKPRNIPAAAGPVIFIIIGANPYITTGRKMINHMIAPYKSPIPIAFFQFVNLNHSTDTTIIPRTAPSIMPNR